MEFVYILAGLALVGLTFFSFTRKPKKSDNGFSIPSGPITRDMKDPYAQAIWAAFDSGKPVSYNAGDTTMKAYNKDTGEIEEIEFKS